MFCGCAPVRRPAEHAHLPDVPRPARRAAGAERARRSTSRSRWRWRSAAPSRRVSCFARKNYFYPDLPKGYQITQYDRPLATGGRLAWRAAGRTCTVRLVRVHLEEDAGKSLHEGFADSDRAAYLDFNRSGVPLAEIVTEPDLRSPADAAEFFRRLRATLVAIGASDGNLEEGSLRCDANVSVRRRGESALGARTEIKNLNSFRFLQRALEYEIARQADVLASGGRVVSRHAAVGRPAGRDGRHAHARKTRRTTGTSRAGPAAARGSAGAACAPAAPPCPNCPTPGARACQQTYGLDEDGRGRGAGAVAGLAAFFEQTARPGSIAAAAAAVDRRRIGAAAARREVSKSIARSRSRRTSLGRLIRLVERRARSRHLRRSRSWQRMFDHGARPGGQSSTSDGPAASESDEEALARVVRIGIARTRRRSRSIARGGGPHSGSSWAR